LAGEAVETMSDDDDDHIVARPELSDDPKMSSAALCIELHLLDQSFRPEFTHQCFADESIRGYQPYRELLLEGKVHKSYKNHDTAKQELSVHVHLAPSGRFCTVDVKSRKKRFQRERRFCSPSKRLKVGTPKSDDDSSRGEIRESTSSEMTSDEEESDFAVDEDHDDDEDLEEAVGEALDSEDEAGDETDEGPMSAGEIKQALKKALPKVKRRGNIKDDYLEAPLGDVLRTYSRKDSEFCIALVKGKDAAKYHTSVQRLALLFIENADDVDVVLEDGGYWKVMYLFRKHSPAKFSLAGFVTLFHFSAPFRKPKPGTVIRVCQAVVLPPYQRSGHGRELLHTVHDLAQGKLNKVIGNCGNSIVEINVEDPAPGFVALRNLVDYERYLMAKKSSEDWLKDYCMHVGKDGYFDLLPESTARELSRMSKLTVQQMQIVYEIDRLHGIPATGENQSQQFEKKYRLMVKKRLNRDHNEDIRACGSKDDMKELLSELYEEQRTMYDRILARARPIR